MRILTWALIGALLLLAGYIAASGTHWYETADFFCLYHGSRSLLSGHDPYDESWWATITGGLYPYPVFHGGSGPSACPGRYGYPLWTAVAMLPFGALPLEPAATLWAALSIAATLTGMILTWRAVGGPRSLAPVLGTLVATSQPFSVLLIGGQVTGVELGLAGAVTLALSRSNAFIAGVGVATMTIKPQIVAVSVPLLYVLGAIRRRRLVLGGAAAFALMVVVPMLWLSSWPAEWLEELGSRRLRVTTLLPTAWGLSADVLGTPALGVALIGALAVSCWLIIRGSRPTLLDAFILSLPLSLFATPYAWSYDELVLAVCWAYLLSRTPLTGTRRILALAAVAALAGAMPWVLYAVAFARGGETLTALVPAINAVGVSLAIRSGSARDVSA